MDLAQESIALCTLIEALTRDEGSSVCIHNLNPDFNAGSNACVTYVYAFGEEQHYRGDTVLDCIRDAAADHDITLSIITHKSNSQQKESNKIKYAATIGYVVGVLVGVGLTIVVARLLDLF